MREAIGEASARANAPTQPVFLIRERATSPRRAPYFCD